MGRPAVVAQHGAGTCQQVQRLIHRGAPGPLSPDHLRALGRDVFDLRLVEAAQRAGAALICGLRLRSLLQSRGRVVGVDVVDVADPASAREMRAPLVIAAPVAPPAVARAADLLARPPVIPAFAPPATAPPLAPATPAPRGAGSPASLQPAPPVPAVAPATPAPSLSIGRLTVEVIAAAPAAPPPVPVVIRAAAPAAAPRGPGLLHRGFGLGQS